MTQFAFYGITKTPRYNIYMAYFGCEKMLPRLCSQKQRNPLMLPLSGLLPLTSVLSVERVILGGRAEFSRKKAPV